MKKVFAVILFAMMLSVLIAGCKKQDEKTDDTKITPTPTEAAKPDKEEEKEDTPDVSQPQDTEKPEPGTVFDAFAQFDQESATGENVPWVYSFTSDKGETFDPLTILEPTGGLIPWHPWGGNWIGVGLNGDTPNRVELNTDTLDGMNGALGFKAPADGKYGILGNVVNPYDQPADLLYARLNGKDLFTVQPGTSEDDPVEFPYTVVDLKAGDIVYFFCPSKQADGWVSVYVDMIIVYEPGDTVPTLPVRETQNEASGDDTGNVVEVNDNTFDAYTQFDRESAAGENVPWLYYVTADEGKTFTPCTVLEATDSLVPWHPVAGNWTGVGLNGDVPGLVELNADGQGGMYGTLSFKAPADAVYTIKGTVSNPWGQPAEMLHIQYNGADLLTVEPSLGQDAEPAPFEVKDVKLKAGDEVFFYCPSKEAGGWVSAYISVTITK
jgi:hypothetical protein